jgi:hypothetical protein
MGLCTKVIGFKVKQMVSVDFFMSTVINIWVYGKMIRLMGGECSTLKAKMKKEALRVMLVKMLSFLMVNLKTINFMDLVKW